MATIRSAVIDYPYAHGPLLDAPLAYTYTAFGGYPFLVAWRRDRDRVAVELGPPVAPSSTASHRHGIDSFLERLRDGGEIEVDPILDEVIAELERGEDPNNDRALRAVIDRLVQKFEISKRWYPVYAGQRFRAVQAGDHTAYRALHRYVRAAEVFDMAYAATHALPYLNVLLKSLDTLCACRKSLDEGLRGRLARLIAREAAHIRNLAVQLCVTTV